MNETKNLLNKIRLLTNWSDATIARKLRMKQLNIANWEYRGRKPHPGSMKKLENLLDECLKKVVHLKLDTKEMSYEIYFKVEKLPIFFKMLEALPL